MAVGGGATAAMVMMVGGRRDVTGYCDDLSGNEWVVT